VAEFAAEVRMKSIRQIRGTILVCCALFGVGIGTGTTCESCGQAGHFAQVYPMTGEMCQGAAGACPDAAGAAQPMDPPTPIVSLRVRVPACGKAGEDLVYKIRAENCSAADAHHVVVRNPLPANARFVRSQPEPSAKTPELQWQLGTLHPGECRDIQLVLAATGPTDLTNCTRVQFEHGECVTTRISGLAPPPPPQVKEQREGAKLELAMTGPKTRYYKRPARYTLTVTNTGKRSATRVLINNPVPLPATFVRASEGGTFLEKQVAWLVGTLEPGQSKKVEVVIQAREPGEICNRATALADQDLKARAEFCTQFMGIAALTPEMFDRKDPIAVGEETSYPIEVTNQGSAPITNLRIKAFVPDGLGLVRTLPAEHKLGERTPDGYQAVLLEPRASLAAGAKATWEVFVRATRAGNVTFKIEVTADQLTAGPVIEEESTTIFAETENGKSPGLETTFRKKKR
jgi:uncharacterized repeat protein (TIGR01451 family)